MRQRWQISLSRQSRLQKPAGCALCTSRDTEGELVVPARPGGEGSLLNLLLPWLFIGPAKAGLTLPACSTCGTNFHLLRNLTALVGWGGIGFSAILIWQLESLLFIPIPVILYALLALVAWTPLVLMRFFCFPALSLHQGREQLTVTITDRAYARLFAGANQVQPLAVPAPLVDVDRLGMIILAALLIVIMGMGGIRFQGPPGLAEQGQAALVVIATGPALFRPRRPGG